MGLWLAQVRGWSWGWGELSPRASTTPKKLMYWLVGCSVGVSPTGKQRGGGGCVNLHMQGDAVPRRMLSPCLFCSLVHCLCLVIPLLHQTWSWGLFPHDSKKLQLTHSSSEDGDLLLYSCYLCWWRNIQALPGDPCAEDVEWRLGHSVWPLSFLPFLPKGLIVECRKEVQTAATQVKNEKKIIKP